MLTHTVAPHSVKVGGTTCKLLPLGLSYIEYYSFYIVFFSLTGCNAQLIDQLLSLALECQRCWQFCYECNVLREIGLQVGSEVHWFCSIVVATSIWFSSSSAGVLSSPTMPKICIVLSEELIFSAVGNSSWRIRDTIFCSYFHEKIDSRAFLMEDTSIG